MSRVIKRGGKWPSGAGSAAGNIRRSTSLLTAFASAPAAARASRMAAETLTRIASRATRISVEQAQARLAAVWELRERVS
jgi:hypothetical protein